MTSSFYEIKQLDEDVARAQVVELLSLSADQQWETWSANNLLEPRSEKWRLSLLATTGAFPIGYAIVSQPLLNLHHLHRLAIAPNYRGRRVGSALMRRVIASAVDSGATLTLKTHRENELAMRFYERLGFRIVDETENLRVLELKEHL